MSLNKYGVLFNLIGTRFDGRMGIAYNVTNLESQRLRLETMRSTFENPFKVAIVISSLQMYKEYGAIISSIRATHEETLT